MFGAKIDCRKCYCVHTLRMQENTDQKNFEYGHFSRSMCWALFPAGTIAWNSHHCQSFASYEQDFYLRRNWTQTLWNDVAQWWWTIHHGATAAALLSKLRGSWCLMPLLRLFLRNLYVLCYSMVFLIFPLNSKPQFVC